jgi:hypothetical protein
MALVTGNLTNSITNPGAATSITFSHTHSAGSNGYLYVVTGHSSGGFTITGVSYNGVALTNIDSRTTTSTTMSLRSWELANPSTGANNVIITMNAGPFNPISVEAISFLGANGFGNATFVDTAGPPVTGTLTVSQNSMILAYAAAGTAGTNLSFTGVTDTIDWNNNANNFIFGGVSNNLNAGSVTFSANASAQPALVGVEIKEFSAAPPATSKNTQIVLL